MRQEGQSYRAIQQWLKERGLSVSVPSIKNHFDEHFPVRQEAAERYYQKSREVFEEAVEKRLSDLEMLDKVIARNYRLHQIAARMAEEAMTTPRPVITKYGPLRDEKTGEIVKECMPPPKTVVELLNGTAAELRQAIKTKAELLGEDEDKNRIDFAELLAAAWERRHEFKPEPDDNE